MFDPKSLSIEILFGSTNNFKVPDYQRSYSWQDDQVEQLWEDIYNSYRDNKDKEDKENYFLGSVVTVKAQKNQKEYKNYQDIVDGQQRLTTLMILFCVVRDLYPNINEGKKYSMKKEQLEKRIKDDYNTERLRVGHEDNGKFEEIILKEGAIKNLDKKPPKKKLSKNKAEDNFKNTACIFKQKLEELEEEDRGGLIDYLCYNVTMIMITCESQPFAIKLFQILNDRGLDLTVSDLVKACLMQKISQDKNKRDQFKNDWNSVKEKAEGIDNLTLDELLTLYVYYHLGKNPKKSTNDEFEALVKEGRKEPFTEDSTVIINNFKNFCELCDKKLNYNNQYDKTMYSLHYLPWKMHWRAILLTALMEKYPDYQKLLKALRRFYYTYWIAGYTLNKVKTTSFDIIKDIKNKKSFNEIQKRIDNKMEKDNAIDKAIKNLKGEVGFEKWIKPLLLMINYNLSEEGISFIKLDKKLHLEHILPQKYKNKWPHITKEVADKYMESIGNLTLVSGRKNIIASDSNFEEKVKVYRGGSDTAKGITRMDITWKIAEKYQHQQWDENSIKAQGQGYLEEVDKLLDIACSKN